MPASRKRNSKRRKTYVMRGCNRKGCNAKNCSKHRTKRATRKRATNKKHASKKMRGGCATCSGGGMKGGSCGSCMRGGGGLPPVPYTPATSLPGAANVGAGNLVLNTYPTDILTNMRVSPSIYLTGGYTYDKKKESNKRNSNLRQKGGTSIIPQDITNVGRGAANMVVGAYNALQGYPQPVSYLPYQDQFPKRY